MKTKGCLARIIETVTLLGCLAVNAPVFASSLPAQPRTVFVQLFEWPWKDVARECETYLGPNGFSAVQVSPPTEHMVWDGSPWWERYQPVSYRLLSRGGNERDFADMVRRCSAAGVDVYVDVVLNHMAGIDDGRGHAGTIFTHYEYPGLYSHADFHHCGRNGNDDIRNFTDLFELQNCELVNLADLNTSSSRVQGVLAGYLNRLLDMGVQGFRVDAAKHMAASDLRGILRRLNRAPYILQELILSPGEPVWVDDYLPLGDINLFSYAYSVGDAFASLRLDRLRNLGTGPTYINSDDAVVFLENHDLQRTANAPLLSYHKDRDAYSLAQVFMLTWPYGYPQLFSSYTFTSYDQGPPVGSDRMTLPVLNSDASGCTGRWLCEHRMPGVAELVRFRNATDGYFYVTDWWSNGHGQIAYGRGSAGYVAINAENTPLDRVLQTRLPAGQYCNLYLGSADCPASEKIVVDGKGYLRVTLPPKSALVLLNAKRMYRQR